MKANLFNDSIKQNASFDINQKIKQQVANCNVLNKIASLAAEYDITSLTLMKLKLSDISGSKPAYISYTAAETLSLFEKAKFKMALAEALQLSSSQIQVDDRDFYVSTFFDSKFEIDQVLYLQNNLLVRNVNSESKSTDSPKITQRK